MATNRSMATKVTLTVLAHMKYGLVWYNNSKTPIIIGFFLALFSHVFDVDNLGIAVHSNNTFSYYPLSSKKNRILETGV
jgi:hypothetical protein